MGEGEAVNPSEVMTHGSANRKVLQVTLMVAGLSSSLGIKV